MKVDAFPTKFDGIPSRRLRIFTTVTCLHLVFSSCSKSFMHIFVMNAERAVFVLKVKRLSVDTFSFIN